MGVDFRRAAKRVKHFHRTLAVDDRLDRGQLQSQSGQPGADLQRAAIQIGDLAIRRPRPGVPASPVDEPQRGVGVELTPCSPRMFGALENVLGGRVFGLTRVDLCHRGVHSGSCCAAQLGGDRVAHQSVAEPVATGLVRRVTDQSRTQSRFEGLCDIGYSDTQRGGQPRRPKFDAENRCGGQRGPGRFGQRDHPPPDDPRHGIGNVISVDLAGRIVQAPAVVQQPRQFSDVERISAGSRADRRRGFAVDSAPGHRVDVRAAQ